MSGAMEIMSPLTEMLWSFGMIAVFCEVSEKVIDEFDAFNEEIYGCNWYLLPKELQRMFLTFILSTQHPKIIRGFGDILCIRQTFKKVIKLFIVIIN